MSRKPIYLEQLNLVARDIETTLAFYRLLGVDIPEESIWRTATGPHHVDVQPPDGASLDFDSPALAAVYNAGFDAGDPQASTLIGFRADTRDAVDARYAELTGAGYEGLQAPYDTFFGARYAIVADPDGRSVGIMSPIDPKRRSAPPEI